MYRVQIRRLLMRRIAFWAFCLSTVFVSLADDDPEPGDQRGGVASDSAPPSSSGAQVNKSANPYLTIAKRNAFGIKPPPPPPPPDAVAPPPPPPSNLFLTGITFLNGVRKAYLVQVEATGKPPKFLTLDEKHGNVDGLQLLSIDVRKRVVRVLNGGLEIALNFKDNGWNGGAGAKSGGGPAAGGLPNGRPMPQPVGIPAAQPPQGHDSGPTIIGRSGVLQRSESGVGNSPAENLSGVTLSDAGNALREIPQRQGFGSGPVPSGSTGTDSSQHTGNSSVPAYYVRPANGPPGGPVAPSPLPPGGNPR